MVFVSSLVAVLGLVALGGLFMGIAKASAEGTNPRSGALGIRTAATKASDAGWDGAHEKAAPTLRATGVVVLGIAALLFLFGLVFGSVPVIPLVAGIAGYALAIAGAVRAAFVADAEAKRINAERGA